MEVGGPLVFAAAAIASLHAMAPDHWLPFAALGRAQRWSAPRTALVTAACGSGHVLVSVGVALAGLLTGVELFGAFGRELEGLAGRLLIGFGLAYALWGAGRSVRARLREAAHARLHQADGLGGCHAHAGIDAADHHRLHAHGGSAGADATGWSLFLLFCADPCVAVIPLMFAAAPHGWPAGAAVVAAYLAATVATMVGLVLPARAAAGAFRGHWADRYGDVLAGGLIAGVGMLVATTGI